ncbi:L-ribulose-5-phosphate 3-epimerase UlaE [termite gut metagenome]|uniref:L-ribulose-5-phosphate 3-epimerase UlaE n=1 Tax=termite gut metagenome TaxID=433724 RepID=A0A5J4SGI6_9ZZZZ
MKQTRRTFFKQSFVSAMLLGAGSLVNAATPGPAKSKTLKAVNPFKLGMAGYTFLNFDLDTTLKTLERLDIHYLCIKDFHLPFKSTDDEIRAFHEKCAAHGVTGYGVGPIYMKSEKEIDDGFEYAKRVGVKLIVGVPNYELLPYVNQKVKEYDFQYAIHLHGPDIATYPDATDVWEHTKGLDSRMGMCFDIGHDLRNNCDPVEDLKKYHTRIFDMHIKDVTDNSKAGTGIEIGRGKIDFPALIKMMREVGYTGMCSLEYEKDMKDPFLGIAESIGYFKALCDNT